MVALRDRAERRRWPRLAAGARVTEGDFRVAWAQQLLAQGLREQARQQLPLIERCYAGPGPPSYVHVNTAGLHPALGDRVRARQQYRRYLRVEPTGPWADLARRRLSALGD